MRGDEGEESKAAESCISTGDFWLRYDLLPSSKVSVYADGSGLVFRSCYSQGGFAFQINATKQNNGFRLIKGCPVKTMSYSFAFLTPVVSIGLSTMRDVYFTCSCKK